MPLADVLYKKDLTRDDLIYLLSLTDADEMQALYDRAYEVKAANVGRVVYYRGLIEIAVSLNFPTAASRTACTAASVGTTTRWSGLTPNGKISWRWRNGLMTTSTVP